MILPQLQPIKNYLLQLQDTICHALEAADGKGTFRHDAWHRPEGGEGRTHVMENGSIIEKAGVNFSHIFGQQLPSASRPGSAGGSPAGGPKAHFAGEPPALPGPFTALGLSLIIHPRNPYIPTAHFNLRFFQAEPKDQPPIWWFGGGFDLTPYYGFTEDCVHWHRTAQQACDPFGKDLYPKFKKWADDYFYLKHRKEPRGIGGLFFDDLQLSRHPGDGLTTGSSSFENSFLFAQSVGNHFLPAYLPIFERRKHHTYGAQEREFQCYRRGRYVEFNLVYDRGTLFGLQWGGRTESILVSLPPEVSWRYDWHPKTGTEEARLYEEFLVPRDWIVA